MYYTTINVLVKEVIDVNTCFKSQIPIKTHLKLNLVPECNFCKTNSICYRRCAEVLTQAGSRRSHRGTTGMNTFPFFQTRSHANDSYLSLQNDLYPVRINEEIKATIRPYTLNKFFSIIDDLQAKNRINVSLVLNGIKINIFKLLSKNVKVNFKFALFTVLYQYFSCFLNIIWKEGFKWYLKYFMWHNKFDFKISLKYI